MDVTKKLESLLNSEFKNEIEIGNNVSEIVGEECKFLEVFQAYEVAEDDKVNKYLMVASYEIPSTKQEIRIYFKDVDKRMFYITVV